MNSPEVTCLQLSYGRPKLSMEAVECFLRQTYENKKLIIINTHPSPIIFKKKYDNIEVYNIKPLSKLSNIYRYGMSLIKSKFFFIWDDDDIFLPWHITDRVRARLNSDCDTVGHKVCFTSVENIIQSLGSNTFTSQYLYDNNNIWPDANLMIWDINWYNKNWKRKFIDFPDKPSYIYRWGTGENHISGLAGEDGQYKVYLNNITEKHKIKFDFPWEPYWQRDYVEDALNFLKI